MTGARRLGARDRREEDAPGCCRRWPGRRSATCPETSRRWCPGTVRAGRCR